MEGWTNAGVPPYPHIVAVTSEADVELDDGTVAHCLAEGVVAFKIALSATEHVIVVAPPLTLGDDLDAIEDAAQRFAVVLHATGRHAARLPLA
jgi:hypothetical protein